MTHEDNVLYNHFQQQMIRLANRGLDHLFTKEELAVHEQASKQILAELVRLERTDGLSNLAKELKIGIDKETELHGYTPRFPMRDDDTPLTWALVSPWCQVEDGFASIGGVLGFRPVERQDYEEESSTWLEDWDVEGEKLPGALVPRTLGDLRDLCMMLDIKLPMPK